MGNLLKQVSNYIRTFTKATGMNMARLDYDPYKIFTKGLTEDMSKLQVHSAVEPLGMYFTTMRPSDAVNLLYPREVTSNSPFAHMRALRNMAYERRTKIKPQPTSDWSTRQHPKEAVIKAALLPEAYEHHAIFEPEEWRNVIRESLTGKLQSINNLSEYPNLMKPKYIDFISSHFVPPENVRDMAETLTTHLKEKRGLHAVSFPDLIVGQPDIYQTVVLKPGSIAARAGRFAGYLGVPLTVGAAAMPSNDEIWQNSEE